MLVSHHQLRTSVFLCVDMCAHIFLAGHTYNTTPVCNNMSSHTRLFLVYMHCVPTCIPMHFQACMAMCAYVLCSCVHEHAYACVFRHVHYSHVCTGMCALCSCVYGHVRMCSHVYKHVHIHVFELIHMGFCLYIHMLTCLHVRNTHAGMLTHMHAYVS